MEKSLQENDSSILCFSRIRKYQHGYVIITITFLPFGMMLSHGDTSSDEVVSSISINTQTWQRQVKSTMINLQTTMIEDYEK